MAIWDLQVLSLKIKISRFKLGTNIILLSNVALAKKKTLLFYLPKK